MILDTDDAMKRLKGALFSEAQAEAETTLLRNIYGNASSNLATRADVALLRSDIERTKRDLSIRLGGMIAAGIGFLAIITFLD